MPRAYGDRCQTLAMNDAPGQPRRQWVDSTDGVQVLVHDFGGGTPEGPLVLAAHPTGFHGMVWQRLAAALADPAGPAGPAGVQVVAADLRGHGATVLPAGVVLDWDGFADDVLAVLDALHVGDRAVVGVGHSKGGAALLRAEARQPGTFRGLWCFEPVVFPAEMGRGRDASSAMAAAALRRRDVFMSALDAEANFGAKPPMAGFDPDVLHAYVEHGFEPADPDDPEGPVRLRCRPEVEAETYRMGAAHNTFELLAGVRCPVVIARGAVSPGPAMFADRIAESLPAGRLLVHEDLSHFGPLEDPVRTANDVAEFLGDLGVRT
jgi:pimeloyl-ACP methyl ester carboxylesterase